MLSPLTGLCMSAAPVKTSDITLNIAACSGCTGVIPRSATIRSRHMAPCGHVLCGECVGKVEAEQKDGKAVCPHRGCGKDLAPAAEFVTAWCTQRPQRLKQQMRNVFQDQGNVGDIPYKAPECSECEPDAATGKPHRATHRCETCGEGAFFCELMATAHPRSKAARGHTMAALPPPPRGGAPEEEADPTAVERQWGMCALHNKEVQVVETASWRPLCAVCLTSAGKALAVEPMSVALSSLEASTAAVAAEASSFAASLDEYKLAPSRFHGDVEKWGADETARIRAWEKREAALVHAVADECAGLVREVCARRLEAGASVITQRACLRTTLLEIEHEIASAAEAQPARADRLFFLYAERAKLVRQLRVGAIAIPSSDTVRAWTALPTLRAAFGEVGAADTGTEKPVAEVARAAKGTLTETRDRLPTAASLGTSPPAMPKLDLDKSPRVVKTDSLKPLTFAPVDGDEDLVVVGFAEDTPIQVRRLSTGAKVRDLEGKLHFCCALANVPGGFIAAGGYNGKTYVIAIFDSASGKRVAELSGHDGTIYGLAFANGHLLSASHNQKALRVWSHAGKGQFVEKAVHSTSGYPYGAISVLSGNTAAVPVYGPVALELWHWVQGRRIATLGDFGDGVHCSSVLPDGNLVVGGVDGVLHIGTAERWSSHTKIRADSEIHGLIATQDGTLVTSHVDGIIRIWREGKCAARVKGVRDRRYLGPPVSIIGARMVVATGKQDFAVYQA